MSETTRRTFLGHVGATAIAAGVLARMNVAHAAPSELSEDERYLWRMLKGIDVGEPFFGDWYLLDAYPPMAGGVALVIAKGVEGDPLRVDVARRGDPVRAPAATDHLELFAMDGGGGVRILPHDLIDAMRALADQLQDNSAQGKLARRLLSHAERVQKFPEFMERAASDLAPVRPEEG